MRRILAGQRSKDIAAALSLKINAVSKIRHDTLFKDGLKKLQASLDERTMEKARVVETPAFHALLGANLEAAIKMVDLMRTAQSEEIQFKAADRILDRTGVSTARHVGTEQGTGNVVIDSITFQNITAGIEALRIMDDRRARGDCVDGTVLTLEEHLEALPETSGAGPPPQEQEDAAPPSAPDPAPELDPVEAGVQE